MNQLHPSIPTDESIEGDLAHDYGASCIDYKARAITAPRDGISDEMHEAVSVYVDDVQDIMRETKVFTPKIEQKIIASSIHELLWGRSDCWLYDYVNRVLYVWDYKHGHSLVEIFENWQFICYIAGIMQELGMDGCKDQDLIIKARVVQPRGFHRDGMIREWVVKASDLRGYFNILVDAATKALGPKAECVTGPHCKNCNVMHACEAATGAGYNFIDATSIAMPIDLTPYQMGAQLRMINRAMTHLKSLKTSLETQVDHVARSGVPVLGFMVESTVSRLNWDKPFSEVKTLGEMYEKKFTKDELITPTQAIKLGVDESVIKAYSSTTVTGRRVVEDKNNKAKQVFSQ